MPNLCQARTPLTTGQQRLWRVQHAQDCCACCAPSSPLALCAARRLCNPMQKGSEMWAGSQYLL